MLNLNTIYNGFDDTVKAPAIQAIQLAIDSIEQTCSSITGVFRERLNGIQQRDAVTNVQTSVNNSFIISKQWYQQMDTMVEEILLDALNEAKIVFKNGLTGTLILGDRQQRVFTALPEYFTISDYDIHITNSQDITKDTEQLRALVPEFVKANIVDPEIIVEAATTKSVSDLKMQIHKSMQKQKAENNQLQQAMQQNQELQQQLQQAQNQLKQLSSKVESLMKLNFNQNNRRIEADFEIQWFKARSDKEYKDAQTENDKRKTEIQLLQLT